ncbi:variant erythrocyte surface antigen-1 beta subunit [Babesia bovis T2Bo]|uniref:variant erythrocyte surface antigen-1 beta subunit n=1 Tax=Babesia bovis T2Bo TaxID=484906 RepID=UPI001D573969|nr:variant erythrocyte surface antigen-1 beta subunit [Babesia bovis T2Bo]EDO05603.2 variant erythrocyte surface antigen-1 beta subunit [Babesia bovis T2Bo]
MLQGTEVIETLIDQLAQGLQKWVGWQEGGNSFGPNITENGIARKWSAGESKKEYRSSYDNGLGSLCTWTKIVNGTTGSAGGSGSAGSASTVNAVKAAQEVHLLARIFLGSVCLIWSGLSQLGFLTKEGSGGDKRWSQDGTLSEVGKGLGSFMAAMGYDLDRLNQGKGKYCLGWSYEKDE